MQERKLSRQAYIFCYKIKAQALHIINFVEIVYHQHKVLHIIKPQERYTLKHDDIRLTAMRCQTCGLVRETGLGLVATTQSRVFDFGFATLLGLPRL